MKSEFQTSKLTPEKGIALPLSQEAHEVLEKSAAVGERAKKREAKLRLEDHCRRFPNWRP